MPRFKFPSHKRVLLLNLVLILQAAGFYVLSRDEEADMLVPLRQWPTQMADWTAVQDVPMDPESLKILAPDDYLIRQYQHTAGPQAHLFVAYFRTQRTGHSPHSPQNCLPGSGWIPVEKRRLEIPLGDRESPLLVNRFLIAKGEEKALVFYWYQTAHRATASEYMARAHLVLDSIQHNRSDTALVRIVIPLGSDEAAAESAAVQLAVSSYHGVQRHIAPL
jgi:EpsI family protein